MTSVQPAEEESAGNDEDDFSERLASLRKAGGRMPQGESRKTQKKRECYYAAAFHSHVRSKPASCPGVLTYPVHVHVSTELANGDSTTSTVELPGQQLSSLLVIDGGLCDGDDLLKAFLQLPQLHTHRQTVCYHDSRIDLNNLQCVGILELIEQPLLIKV